MKRIVIGVDPAVTKNENSDETGIIVTGLGYDDKIYVIDDLSGKYKAAEWARVVANASWKYKANRVVAEVNNGGDLVEGMLRNIDKNIPFSSVRAIKGKVSRAEPVALLYESGNVYHSRSFEELEEQMQSLSYDDEGGSCRYDDRLDALVWAVSELTARPMKVVSAPSISVI